MSLPPTRKRFLFEALCLVLICIASSSCNPATIGEVGDGPIPSRNEIVMSPGSTLTATNTTGTISIEAGKGLKRTYTWDGATRSVEMWPRGERWYGSLGLYYPGPGRHWKPHQGISRCVVEEGQQHFKTVDEAMKWIAGQEQWTPLVYRNDGLAVGWSKALRRAQLNVGVWQIYIDGKKPTELPGSLDSEIVVKESENAE